MRVAEAAARLREPEQHVLADQLAKRGRLTLPDVSDVERRRMDEAKAELPGELFGERALPWQATARAQLIAALHAIPDARRDEPVARLVARAVLAIERS